MANFFFKPSSGPSTNMDSLGTGRKMWRDRPSSIFLVAPPVLSKQKANTPLNSARHPSTATARCFGRVLVSSGLLAALVQSIAPLISISEVYFELRLRHREYTLNESSAHIFSAQSMFQDSPAARLPWQPLEVYQKLGSDCWTPRWGPRTVTPPPDNWVQAASV